MNHRKPSLEELETRLAQLKIKVQQHITNVNKLLQEVKEEERKKSSNTK